MNIKNIFATLALGAILAGCFHTHKQDTVTTAVSNSGTNKQDYPLEFRSTYLTPKAALDAEEIWRSEHATIDITTKSYGVTTPLTSEQMALIKSQGLITITFDHDISDVTAIEPAATRAILNYPTPDEDVVGFVNSKTFIGGGSEKELATDIKNSLQDGLEIGAFLLQPAPLKVVKFKFQIAADKDGKYNPFEKTIYWITNFAL